jgi:hypothetical protein
MKNLKPAVLLSDQELIWEWECLDESDYLSQRADELSAELELRYLDF